MAKKIHTDCFLCHIHRYEHERLSEKIIELKKEKKALFDELAAHKGSSAYTTTELRNKNRLAYEKNKKGKQCQMKKNSFLKKFLI